MFSLFSRKAGFWPGSPSTYQPVWPDDIGVSVCLLGPPSDIAAQVLEIADLVGVKIGHLSTIAAQNSSEPENPSINFSGIELVIICPGNKSAGARHQNHEEQPKDEHLALFPAHASIVRVGSGSGFDFSLPEQAHTLAQQLAQIGHKQLERSKIRDGVVLLVSSWQAGQTASKIARLFAKAGNALLLEASGQPTLRPANQVFRANSSSEQLSGNPCLNWSTVDPNDPPMPTELLRGTYLDSGVKVLTYLPTDPVRVDDQRVLSVILASTAPIVVDGGSWTPEIDNLRMTLAGKGRVVKTVLAGTPVPNREDLNDFRLPNVLGAMSGLCAPEFILIDQKRRTPNWITTGTSTELLSGELWGLSVKGTPRREKQWQELWGSIWRQDRRINHELRRGVHSRISRPRKSFFRTRSADLGEQSRRKALFEQLVVENNFLNPQEESGRNHEIETSMENQESQLSPQWHPIVSPGVLL